MIFYRSTSLIFPTNKKMEHSFEMAGKSCHAAVHNSFVASARVLIVNISKVCPGGFCQAAIRLNQDDDFPFVLRFSWIAAEIP